MSLKLLFARHGESEANLLNVMSNRDMPHGLTPKGKAQAIELAAAVLNEGVVHVYASPIPRARETAEIVASHLGVPVNLADGLREFDCGEMEGRGDDYAWMMHTWVQSEWFSSRNHEARIEGGESFTDVETRFREALDQAIEAHGDENGTILFISHGATLTAMLPSLLQNLPRKSLLAGGLDYATTIEAQSDGDHWLCTAWNGEPFQLRSA